MKSSFACHVAYHMVLSTVSLALALGYFQDHSMKAFNLDNTLQAYSNCNCWHWPLA